MLSVPAINNSVAANTTRPVPRIPYLLELNFGRFPATVSRRALILSGVKQWPIGRFSPPSLPELPPARL
jgi:hypothetical protein